MNEAAETDIPSLVEVRAVIPIPFASSRKAGIVGLAILALGAAYCAVAWPSFALRYALPLGAFVATMLVRIVCMRPSPISVRFDARGVANETTGVESRSPWSAVTRIVDDPAALVVEFRAGHPLRIPWRTKPDLRAILALAPKSVVFQARGATPNRRRFGWTLGLWLFLIVLMMAIYSLLAQEAP